MELSVDRKRAEVKSRLRCSLQHGRARPRFPRLRRTSAAAAILLTSSPEGNFGKGHLGALEAVIVEQHPRAPGVNVLVRSRTDANAHNV